MNHVPMKIRHMLPEYIFQASARGSEYLWDRPIYRNLLLLNERGFRYSL